MRNATRLVSTLLVAALLATAARPADAAPARAAAAQPRTSRWLAKGTRFEHTTYSPTRWSRTITAKNGTTTTLQRWEQGTRVRTKQWTASGVRVSFNTMVEPDGTVERDDFFTGPRIDRSRHRSADGSGLDHWSQKAGGSELVRERQLGPGGELKAALASLSLPDGRQWFSQTFSDGRVVTGKGWRLRHGTEVMHHVTTDATGAVVDRYRRVSGRRGGMTSRQSRPGEAPRVQHRPPRPAATARP